MRWSVKSKRQQRLTKLMQIPIPKTDESDRFAVYRVNSIEGQELERRPILSVDLFGTVAEQ